MTRMAAASRAFAFTLAAATLFGAEARAEQETAARLGPVPESREEGAKWVVAEESIDVRCVVRGGQLECDSKSRLSVENPLSSSVKLALEVDPLARRLEVNGVSLPLTTPEGRQVQVAAAELEPGRSELLVHIPIAFRIDASAKASDLFTPVLVTRHPLLHEYPGDPAAAELTLQSVGRSRRWKRVERTRVTLTYPGKWRWMPADDAALPPPQCPSDQADGGAGTASGSPECTRTLPGGEVRVEWVRSRTDSEPDPFARTVALAPRGRTLFNGGPFLGVGIGGGAGCLGCKEAIRVRGGYEIGVDSWGLLALAGEFSPRNRFVLVPSFDLALLPHIASLCIPAVTIGAGVPLQVSPRALVGARAQVSAVWPVASALSVGSVFMLDVYPGQRWIAPVLLGAALQVGL